MPELPIHPLEKYRKDQEPKLSQADIARAIYASEGTIRRAEHGLPISKKFIDRLVALSKGDLTPADFLSSARLKEKSNGSKKEKKDRQEKGRVGPYRRRHAKRS